MSTIKSFSVGNGDMFYINHNTDNFSIIDCCLSDNNKERIVKEIKRVSKGKGIMRFMSTHPDDDHMGGLKFFDENIGIYNFYKVVGVVKTRNFEESDGKNFLEIFS